MLVVVFIQAKRIYLSTCTKPKLLFRGKDNVFYLSNKQISKKFLYDYENRYILFLTRNLSTC